MKYWQFLTSNVIHIHINNYICRSAEHIEEPKEIPQKATEWVVQRLYFICSISELESGRGSAQYSHPCECLATAEFSSESDVLQGDHGLEEQCLK